MKLNQKIPPGPQVWPLWLQCNFLCKSISCFLFFSKLSNTSCNIPSWHFCHSKSYIYIGGSKSEISTLYLLPTSFPLSVSLILWFYLSHIHKFSLAWFFKMDQRKVANIKFQLLQDLGVKEAKGCNRERVLPPGRGLIRILSCLVHKFMKIINYGSVNSSWYLQIIICSY